jgi:hypothetical protein
MFRQIITPKQKAINEVPCEDRNRPHGWGIEATSTINLRRDARSMEDAASFMNSASLLSLTLTNKSTPQEPKNSIPDKIGEKR